MSHFRKSPAKATSRLGNLRNAYLVTYSTVAQYCLSVCLPYVDLIFVTQIKRPPHSGLTIPWRKFKKVKNRLLMITYCSVVILVFCDE
jgi:hypothetical protein